MGGDLTRSSVAVVILSWNDKADVLRCLEAVVAADVADEIIVVDNASRDGTVPTIKSLYPQVTVLENPENLGYAGGNNVGMRYALERDADYVLLLNDDAVLAEDAIPELVRVGSQHPEAGFLGPNVYAIEDRTRFLSSGGAFDDDWRPVHRGLGEEDEAAYATVTEVDFLSGCALLVKREALEETGLLDERFFAYHEDVDWCYRAKQKAFKLLVVPAAKVWHPDPRQRDVDSAVVTYYDTRNSLLFLSKHHLGTRVMLRRLLRYLITAINWALRPKWRHKRPQRKALVRALIDFAGGRFGRAERLEQL